MKKWMMTIGACILLLAVVFTAEAWRDRPASHAEEKPISSYEKNKGKRETGTEKVLDHTESSSTHEESREEEPQEDVQTEKTEETDKHAEDIAEPEMEQIGEKEAPSAPEESTAGNREEPKGAEQSAEKEEQTCVLSVRCDTLLAKLGQLSAEKQSLVPGDGILFPEAEVVFYEGESVFHVLQREMKKNRIHMEFVNTPGYQSAYIEGIGNLYEFDCGELSGWMYRVNGQAPGYGSSRWILQDGDVIEWLYTCDLGRDVGSELKEKQR